MMETLKKKQHTHTLIIQNEFWFIRLPGEGWDPGAWNDTARSWVKQKPIFSVPEDALYTCVCVCVWLLFFCHTLSSRSQASWKRRQVPQEKSVTFSGQHAWSPWDMPLPSLGPGRWLTALSLPERYHAEFSVSCGPVCSPLSYFITCRTGAVGVTWSLAVQNGFRLFSVIEGKCDTPLGFHLEKAFST